MITKFSVGTTYGARSICDYDCIFTYTVTKRTDKTVWLKARNGKITSRRVRIWDDVEACDPQGRYSMSPILTADKVL